MPQSLTRIYVHTVFSTKHRFPFVQEADRLERLHRFMGSVSKQLGSDPVRVGGVADHVHLLVNIGRKMAVSDYVKELKRVSSRWVKGRWCDAFSWQRGYRCFSVSERGVEAVTRYIERQPEHHRNLDFVTEYRGLLKQHHVEYDERYVWD